MKKIDYTKLHAQTVYSGKLSSTGDEDLDAMWLVPHVRIKKETVAAPEKCPGCDRVTILTRGHYATLCDECHEDIQERASRPI